MALSDVLHPTERVPQTFLCKLVEYVYGWPDGRYGLGCNRQDAWSSYKIGCEGEGVRYLGIDKGELIMRFLPPPREEQLAEFHRLCGIG